MSIILEKKKLRGLILDREEIILGFSRGKEVLHLGCSDYPFSLDQYKKGNLLHEKIQKVSKRVIGVDISRQGIDLLSSLGFENLIVGDVEELKDITIGETFQVIIAGELVEHVSNLGKCFENIRCVMNKESILIISVPNAHSVKSFVRVLLGYELIHQDHLYYFSPATMEHISKRFAYEMVDYFYYLGEPTGCYKRVCFYIGKVLIKYVTPFVADGLIFIFKRKD